MAFLEKKIFETLEEEQARLAQYPENSQPYLLSKYPVNIPYIHEGLLIRLPRTLDSDPHITVVPVKPRPESSPERGVNGKFQRHSGTWEVMVVASDHPSYPVGGYRIIVPNYELVRGERVTIDTVPQDTVEQNPSSKSVVLQERTCTVEEKHCTAHDVPATEQDTSGRQKCPYDGLSYLYALQLYAKSLAQQVERLTTLEEDNLF